jgi:hypothetical protein
MGGPKQAFKTLVDTAVGKKIIKPKLKTPEEGKETSKRLDKVLTKNAEEGNEAAAALLNKRKGRRKTIMTSASGLNEEEEIKKKTLLG